MVTAEQAAARDRAAIDAGTDSTTLMRRAGERAAHCISLRYPRVHKDGVIIHTGPGNNGGDGWVVAAVCASQGIPVHVVPASDPATPDARWAKGLVRNAGAPLAHPAVVVDALLGTGASGPPRDPIAGALSQIATQRVEGAAVVALDLPSGLDATTGVAASSVHADLTISFGTFKRGQLMRRELCGELVVCDIGLGPFVVQPDDAAVLIDAAWVRSRLPAIPADAHKGTRRRLLFVGGGAGMAGAVILASRAALGSGAGMVRCCVAPESVGSLQAAVPEATVVPWPGAAPLDADVLAWADALLIGPGLGRAGAREQVERWLGAWRGPVVLDADALSAFAGAPAALGALLAGREAVMTPHAGEAARLLGCAPAEVVAGPFAAAAELAQQLQTVVLLKGVPTVIDARGTASFVSARGTPVLATAGSGDVLAGIVTTLLAQCGDAVAAAGIGAWAHGRAAEGANAGRPVRGVTLADVLAALPTVWGLEEDHLHEGEIAWLPRVGDG